MRPLSICLIFVAVALTSATAIAVPGELARTEMLPAWELEREQKKANKADEWDDYRDLHPEWFGVTAPPTVAIRPFAEYEPTQAVMLRPSKSISKFHKEILKGLHGHVDLIALLHVPEQLSQLDEQLNDLGMLDNSIDRIDIGEINANWTRDYGPLSVVTQDNRIGLVEFR